MGLNYRKDDLFNSPQGGALSFSPSRTWTTTAPTQATMTHPHKKIVNLNLHQVKHKSWLCISFSDHSNGKNMEPLNVIQFFYKGQRSSHGNAQNRSPSVCKAQRNKRETYRWTIALYTISKCSFCSYFFLIFLYCACMCVCVTDLCVLWVTTTKTRMRK